MNEYKVTFRGAFGRKLDAYIYADDEYEARKQAVLQHIDQHSIVSVSFVGPRKEGGHI